MIYLNEEKKCIYSGLFRPKGDYFDRIKFSGLLINKDTAIKEINITCEKDFLKNLIKLQRVDIEFYIQKFSNQFLQNKNINHVMVEIALKYKVCCDPNIDNIEFLKKLQK